LAAKGQAPKRTKLWFDPFFIFHFSRCESARGRVVVARCASLLKIPWNAVVILSGTFTLESEGPNGADRVNTPFIFCYKRVKNSPSLLIFEFNNSEA
jgi:hypothetical protein